MAVVCPSAYSQLVLRPISNLPDGVIGMEAVGEFSVEDYTATVEPELEKLEVTHATLRLLLHLGTEFTGFGEGSWGDLTHELRSTPFHRGAVVTDDNTVRAGMSLLRFTLHGHVRYFSNHDFDKAADWVAG
jgi:hypothetical protein